MFTGHIFIEVYYLICCISFCSQRVILLRAAGSEITPVTSSEAMRITCAYCLDMFFVSFTLHCSHAPIL